MQYLKDNNINININEFKNQIFFKDDDSLSNKLTDIFHKYQLKIGVLGDDRPINLDEEQDILEEFKEGGYAPIFVGEILCNRYVVKKVIQIGDFSSVWSCLDVRRQINVAMKIMKNNDATFMKYYE